MVIKQTRTVFHLAITKKTALRVVLYVAEDKLDWYNDSDIHPIVLEKLQPIILNHVTKNQGNSLAKRQKESEKNHIVYASGCRITYRFTTRNQQQTLVKMEKDYEFKEEDDEKPTLKTSYQSLSIYPDQLLLSVDDDTVNTSTSQSSINQFFR